MTGHEFNANDVDIHLRFENVPWSAELNRDADGWVDVWRYVRYPWERPDAPSWPHFVPFPRLAEANRRARAAWDVIRNGVPEHADDEGDDW